MCFWISKYWTKSAKDVVVLVPKRYFKMSSLSYYQKEKIESKIYVLIQDILNNSYRDVLFEYHRAVVPFVKQLD